MGILPFVIACAQVAAVSEVSPQVDPYVLSVTGVGYWNRGTSAGSIRVLVARSRDDESDSEIWLEWVENPKPTSTETARVIMALKVKELSNRGLNVGSPEVIRLRPETVVRFHTSRPTRYPVMVAIKGVGWYKCLGCD